MPTKVLNITNIDDIKRIEEAILNNENFEIGEIKPIHFKLKLDGGRFENYDPRFIDKFVAKTILSQQSNYEKILKEIEKQYNVKIPSETKLLKFELEKGSLDLLTDLAALVEVFKGMESIHQLYAVLGITGGLFTYMGFGKYIDYKKHELETKSKETANKLSGEEQERYLETINKSVEAIKEISQNVVIQKAINKPKQDIADMLEHNETLTINDDTKHEITKAKANEFDVIPPQIDDIEEEIEDLYNISTYYFRSDEKYFKLDGISEKANSLPMPPKKRMKIITKAEAQKTVKLKLKIIKDGLTEKIKAVYILDYMKDNSSN